MADLIPRAAAIEAIRECWQRVNKFAKPYDLTRVVECIKAIDDLPTIDAIPMWWIIEKFLDVLNEDSELSKAVWLVHKAWQKEQEA